MGISKRKARELKDQRRRPPSREQYDYILIVCEGEKTERNYFIEMRRDLKLSSANIVIPSDGHGSHPKNVVNFALGKWEEDKSFDKIYCVIDRDSHDKFSDVIKRVSDLRESKENPIPIEIIPSYPCFEIWLLLHFQYSSRPYQKCGKKSGCDCVVKDLRATKHLPNYQKNSYDIYTQTKDKLEIAIRNSKKLLTHHAKCHSDLNPSTQIHKLMEHLQKMKDSK